MPFVAYQVPWVSGCMDVTACRSVYIMYIYIYIYNIYVCITAEEIDQGMMMFVEYTKNLVSFSYDVSELCAVIETSTVIPENFTIKKILLSVALTKIKADDFILQK